MGGFEDSKVVKRVGQVLISEDRVSLKNAASSKRLSRDLSFEHLPIFEPIGVSEQHKKIFQLWILRH